ncbi:hypothetical protein DFP72DRAFT_852577 [Ephemerocybe angulata]|uniref:Uncharacterized protein n=1 Tax=Ephemerocybe angulata TaxID=980116 RepID=A0A8H6M2Q6_9AGAR|nr:hypothetical protein DFP72DRAFT_852577 [Tulosesus angulatus]
MIAPWNSAQSNQGDRIEGQEKLEGPSMTRRNESGLLIVRSLELYPSWADWLPVTRWVTMCISAQAVAPNPSAIGFERRKVITYEMSRIQCEALLMATKTSEFLGHIKNLLVCMFIASNQTRFRASSDGCTSIKPLRPLVLSHMYTTYFQGYGHILESRGPQVDVRDRLTPAGHGPIVVAPEYQPKLRNGTLTIIGGSVAFHSDMDPRNAQFTPNYLAISHLYHAGRD